MAHIAFALVVYAATVAIAVAQGWRANDLVWGFWISGITVTLYAAVAVPLFSFARRRENARSDGGITSSVNRVIQAVGLSFVTLGAFVLLVVPLFFGATGFMLNSLSPLMPKSTFDMKGGSFFGVFMLVEEALGRFWPLAIASCIACSSSIYHATANARENEENQFAGTIATIEAIRAAAVVVLAMFIQLSLGKFSRNGVTIANYLLLVLLLLPWATLFEWNTQKSRRNK